MRYQFNLERALKKRIETIKQLRGFGNIEEEMKEFLHNKMIELHEQGEKEWSSFYQVQWMRWNKYCNAWMGRIGRMETSQLSLDLLQEQNELTIEEAFFISLGINPDTLINPSSFLNWGLHEIPNLKRLEAEDRPLLNDSEAYPAFWNIEERLRRFPEYIKLERKWPSDKINTQEFIDWALSLGYIEPRRSEYYREVKDAPYDVGFATLLYEELRKARLIKGEYNEQWRWTSSDNSLAWLCKDLYRHKIPKSCLSLIHI